MKRSLLLLLVLGSACSKKLQPPDAGVAPPARPVSTVALPDAGFRLTWISEQTGEPQVVVDGAALTRGSAAHYSNAVTREGVWATQSEGGLERVVFVPFSGALRVVSPPSSRARGVSTANGLTIFESGEGGAMSNLARADGGFVVVDETGSFEPNVAPDGTWFAFVSSRDGDAEIYRANADGGAQVRLTAFHTDDLTPKVSPDGKWIAFISNREGQDRLFIVKPDGRNVRRLHDDDVQDTRWDAGSFEPAETDAVWTPDSRALVFAARGPNGYWHLWLADVASGKRTRLSDGAWDDQMPSVSPDGEWIAFVSSRDGNAELYVMQRGQPPARVTTNTTSDWKPLWVP